jgi:UDP-N-acetylmuramate dehydrogenase
VSALVSVPVSTVEWGPLGRQTSLRAGGRARWYWSGSDSTGAQKLLDLAADEGREVFPLGGGSNLLVSDEGFNGLVLKYTRADHQKIAESDGSVIVRVAAGASLSNLARRLARDGIAGLEWAATVPGTVGGAAVNNAGAFGGCIADHLVDLDVLQAGSGHRTIRHEEMAYAYRMSTLKHASTPPALVTSVRLRLRTGDPERSLQKIKECQDRRSATQPRQLSAGSIFANPSGDYSGRLIEAVGLKGERSGDAAISTQHANFIVNAGSATSRDVFSLMRRAQDAVWGSFAIWLVPEVQLVGAWDPRDLNALSGPNGRGAA